MHPDFSHIRDWIFDLDNCLYPASSGLFTLIDARMNAYIRRLLNVDETEAHRIQKKHFISKGTTLKGLMEDHGVDARDFLGDVHDIPLDRLDPNPRLAEGLGRLPGRRFVFTNGDEPYARRVLGRLGVEDRFDAVHCIFANDLRPKPERHGYDLIVKRFDIDPRRALLAEDMVKNLAPAKAMGMTTVWVDNGSEQAQSAYDPAIVDHRIGDVGEWLHDILDGEPIS